MADRARRSFTAPLTRGVRNFALPPREHVERVRAFFPVGCRVVLLETMRNDPDPVEAETTGAVVHVDDAGGVFVHWDNGRRLAALVLHDDKLARIDAPEEQA